MHTFFPINYSNSHDTIKVIRSGRWLIGCLNDYHLFVYDIDIVNIVTDSILVSNCRRWSGSDSEILVIAWNVKKSSSITDAAGMKSFLLHRFPFRCRDFLRTAVDVVRLPFCGVENFAHETRKRRKILEPNSINICITHEGEVSCHLSVNSAE